MRGSLKYILILALICVAFGVIEPYTLEYPDYFPKPAYNLSKEPLTDAKIELGRTLFYDPMLSDNNSISCASCHSPFNAFAHTDHDLSHGIHDSIGFRNAPALFNLVWQKSFMWDGAINHLDVQSLAPISSRTEMGSNISDVIDKLKAHDRYPQLFENAFGLNGVTGQNILLSLAQFQVTLVSANSKYDQVQVGTYEFNEQEVKGYELFKSNCASCHQEPLFTNVGFERNGLGVDTTLNDFGRLRVSGKSEDSLLFKVPSLRNLKYTSPYMHDGRFKKLRHVLAHYSSEEAGNSLENSISLTSKERTDVIAFLRTLNDSSFVFNKKHQIPLDFFNPSNDN
ncbi:MAG: cytochrome c peroxidase [Candidatus Latescibacterota bacterium]|jgi:cytochrome c peroxidase